MKSGSKNVNGFTLVEISIVMIIVGLLIGGTFGGMKLIENMQVNKTVQDLKAIESAALTFRDTYGRLPGDMPNTAARLPNCADAPCATGGNGNRIIGASNLANGAIANTSENFTFWHHLQASDLFSFGIENTTDMTFGEGQPESDIGGGIRLTNWISVGTCPALMRGAIIAITTEPSAPFTTESAANCEQLSSVDRKIDDGIVDRGRFVSAWGCNNGVAPSCYRRYTTSGVGTPVYDLQGF